MSKFVKINGFDWDVGNQIKCQKHGVSIFEIEYALQNPFATFDDLVNSALEKRYRIIAKSPFGRYIFVVFTIRLLEKKPVFRPISARYMHQKEVINYEKK